MATLSVDGVAIAEINGVVAGQLKRLASDGMGASAPPPEHGARAASASPATGPKVTCCITLEFAKQHAAG